VHSELTAAEVKGPTPPGGGRAVPTSWRRLGVISLVVLGACVLDELTAPPIDPATVQFTVSGDTLVPLGGNAAVTYALPGGPSPTVHVTWSSSNTGIATVDSATGVVTGVALGNATLTATLTAPELDTGITRTHLLRVKYASIAIDPVDSLTGLGQTRQLIARGRNAAGTPIAQVAAVFSAPDALVAAVDAAGLARAVSNGTVQARAVFDRDTAFAPVKVRQVAKSVTFGIAELVFQAMQRDTSITATILDTQDSVIASPPGGITWGTANAAVVSINPTTGVMQSLQRINSSISITVDTVTRPLPTRVQQVVDHIDPCSANMTADTVGKAIATAPCVDVEDAGNVGVPDVIVTFAPATGGGSITNPVDTTDANGRAAVGSWTLGTASGTNNNSLSVTGASKNATITMSALADAPNQVGKVTADSQATAVTSPVAVPPGVLVSDQYGNPAPGVSVTFTVTLGGGTINSGLTTVTTPTNASGIAAVSSWTVGNLSGTYNNRLTVTVPGTALSTFFTASATSGLPSQIAASCAINQSAIVGAAVPTAPCVVVRDNLDNPVEGVSVTFTPTTGGGNVTGGTALTNASGVATVGSWTLGTVAGTNNNTLEATFTGFSGSPVVFTASALAGAQPFTVSTNAGDNQTDTVAQTLPVAPAVSVVDFYGNVMSGASVTFTVTGGGGTVNGSAQLTNPSGVATVGSWTLGTTAGTQTLRAVSGGDTVVFTATAVPGAPTQILANTGNGQSATVNQLVAVAPAAKVADQYGNGVAGISVTFAVGTGGGSITGPGQITDANGLATVGSWRLGQTAGTSNNTLGAIAPPIVGAATFTASANAGVAVTVEINAGNNQTAEVGTAVGTAPAAFVKDSFNNAVSGVVVTYAVGLGGGSVTGASATSNASGIARVGSWTLGSSSGTSNNTLTATSAGLGGSPLTFTASGTAGAAQNIAVQAGNTQTATAGSAVGTPPSVLVTDRFGNPKSGINVTFAAGAGNGTISGPATVATNTSGIAAVGGWTLSTVSGQDTLTATSAGLTGSPILFTATAAAGAATQILVDGGQGQSGSVGTTLPTAYTVKVADANGNGVSGVSVSWAATGGGGSITPPTSLTNAQGIATASRTLGVGVGTDSAEATVPALTLAGEPLIFTASATAGAAATLEANSLTSQSDTVADSAAAAPSVLITDQFGNPKSGISVTFAVTGGGGQILGGATKITNALGVATVNAWVLGDLAGPNTLTATSAGLTGSPLTFTATGLAGAATTIAVDTGDGQTLTVNSAVSLRPAVIVTDAFGNPKPGVAVTFAMTGPIQGSITGGSQTTNAQGIATIGSWTLSQTAGNNTIDANATSLTLTGEPVTFTVTGTAGVATQIASNSLTSQSAPVGSAVAQAPSVIVKDQFNNPKQGVSVTFTVTGGGGLLVGGSPQVVATNASGIATAGNWTLGNTAGTNNNTVTGASTGLAGTPVTFTASATVGAASQITIQAGDDQSALVGNNVPTPPSVRVSDQFGNPVGSVSVSFSVAQGTGTVNGGSSANVSTNPSGIASLTTWNLASAGTHRVDASASGTPTVAFDATGITTTATTIALFDGNGQTEQVGTQLAADYRVLVTDAGAAPVAGVTVSWSVVSGGGLLSAATSITDASGHAAVRHTLGPVEGIQQVNATVGGLSGSPVTFSATATGVPPSDITLNLGDGQSAVVNTAIGTAPSVLVTDNFGQPKNGISITFTITGGGGYLNGNPALTTVNTSTNASGIASLTSWTLGTTSGGNALQATSSHPNLAGEFVDFTATGTPAAAQNLAISGGNGQSGTVGQPLAAPFQVLVSDQFGNGVSGISVNWTVTLGGGSISSSSVTDVNGHAVQTLTLGNAPGPNQVEASNGGLSPTLVTFIASAGAGGPDNIQVNLGNGQTATVNTVLPTNPSVLVRDALGNAVPGVTVSFEITQGNGLINGFPSAAFVNTDGSGVATVPGWTLGTGAGTNTIAATTASLPGDTVFINGTGTADVANQLILNAGDDQTGTVGAALSAPYSVQVVDQFGNGVSGITVNWTVTGVTGGSITPTSITNASGFATATRVLGSTSGTQTAEASTPGLAGSPVPFSATAQPGAPSIMVVWVGNGQVATVGTQVATAPAVLVADQFGNPVADGFQVTFTPSAGGVVLGTPATTAGGIASVAGWQLSTVAGSNQLDANATGLPTVVFSASGSPGPPNQFLLHDGDAQAATVNTAVPILPAVRVVDQYGNGIPFISVDFSQVFGGGGVTNPFTQTDADGVARVGSWTLGTAAGSGNSLNVYASPFVNPVTFTATALPDAPAFIFQFSGSGQTATVGTPVAAEPTVIVVDQFGNPVSGVEVPFTPVDGGFGVGSVGDPVDTTDASGLAGPQTWTLSTTSGTNYLQGSINGGAQVVFFDANGQPGAAVALVPLGTDGQAEVVGNFVPQFLAARAVDQYGNAVSGVPVTVRTGAGNGLVFGADTLFFFGTDAFGVAVSWQLDTVAGQDTIEFHSLGLAGSPVRYTATAVPGAPKRLIVIQGDGQGTQVNTPVPVIPTVKITDVYGNAIPGITVFWNTCCGAFVDSNSSTTNAQGLANPGNWTLGSGTGTYPLDVSTFIGLSGEPFTFSGTAISGDAQFISMRSGDGQFGTVNTNLPGFLVAAVTDQFGNGVVGVPVTWTVTGGGGSLIVHQGTTDFFGYSYVEHHLGTTAGPQTVEASVGGLIGSPVVFTGTGTPDAAYQVVIASGGGQTAEVNTALPVAPTFRITDQYGNGVPNWYVEFAWTSGFVSTFNLCTDAGGYAPVTWTLGTVAGPQQLYAYTGAQMGADGGIGCVGGAALPFLVNSPLQLDATAAPGPVTTVQVSPGSAAFGALGSTRQFTAAAFDTYGNSIPSATFNWDSDDDGIVGVGLTTGLAQANGVGGPLNIRASFGSVFGSASVSVTQVPFNIQVTPTSATLDSAQSQAFSAVARDSNNNVIPAAPFTWTSLKPLVASVNGAGSAFALAGGQTTIRASSGPANGYALVTVSQRNYGNAVGTWTTADSLVVGSYRDMWGTASNDIYATTGSATIRRWNGSSWSTFAVVPGSPSLFAIWGTSNTDFFVASNGGQIYHYDGISFTQQAVIGSGFWSLWGSSPTDVFAVGYNGVIAHYNGTSWSTQSQPAGPVTFYGVWGTGPDNVWAVGSSGTILRYDGNNWQIEANGGIGTTAIHGVWGSGSDTVFAAAGIFSGSGAILRRVGGVWSPMTSGATGVNLYRVWGTASNEVYAVGDNGTVRRWNGTAWSGQTTNTTNWMWGIYGTAGGDVLIGGSGGFSKRGRRGVSSVVVTPGSATAGAINSTKQFTAAAFDADGNSLSRTFTWSDVLPGIASVNSTGLATAQGNGTDTIRATPTIETWVSGKAPYTVNQVTDSIAVTAAALTLTIGNTANFSATALDSNNFAISGKTFTWSSLNTAVATIPAGPSASGTATSAAAGQTTIRASVDGRNGYGLLTSSATGLAKADTLQTTFAPVPATSQFFYRTWGSNASNIFTVGDGSGGAASTIYRWNGASWGSTSGATVAIRDVWGLASNDVYAVGVSGTILRWQGASWTAFTSPTLATIGAIWGAAPDDIFIALEGAGSNNIYRWNGVSWSAMTVPANDGITAMWGVSRNDVWAVGIGGDMLHWNGSTWTLSNPQTNALFGIWGYASNQIWAAGNSGTILRYNGASWSVLTTPSASAFMRRVWGTSNADIYVVGLSGALWRVNGSTVSTLSSGTATGLLGIWGYGTGTSPVWASGGSGLIRRGTR
jgi:Big-like domain-containing protein